MIPGPAELAILAGAIAVLFFSGRLPQAWALIQKQLGTAAARKAEGVIRDTMDQAIKPDEPEPPTA